MKSWVIYFCLSQLKGVEKSRGKTRVCVMYGVLYLLDSQCLEWQPLLPGYLIWADYLTMLSRGYKNHFPREMYVPCSGSAKLFETCHLYSCSLGR